MSFEVVIETFTLTEPELSSENSKSSAVVSPIAPEVDMAVLTSLEHLYLR